MVSFYLNTFLVVVDACEGVNNKWEACSSKNSTRSTHISNYQSSKRESNQQDESDSMKFPSTLKNALLIIRDHFGLSFAIKGLGYVAALYLKVTITCSLQIIFLSTYPLPTISLRAENTLLKTTCHILLLLVRADTLTYRKDYN